MPTTQTKNRYFTRLTVSDTLWQELNDSYSTVVELVRNEQNIKKIFPLLSDGLTKSADGQLILQLCNSEQECDWHFKEVDRIKTITVAFSLDFNERPYSLEGFHKVPVYTLDAKELAALNENDIALCFPNTAKTKICRLLCNSKNEIGYLEQAIAYSFSRSFSYLVPVNVPREARLSFHAMSKNILQIFFKSHQSIPDSHPFFKDSLPTQESLQKCISDILSTFQTAINSINAEYKNGSEIQDCLIYRNIVEQDKKVMGKCVADITDIMKAIHFTLEKIATPETKAVLENLKDMFFTPKIFASRTEAHSVGFWKNTQQIAMASVVGIAAVACVFGMSRK